MGIFDYDITLPSLPIPELPETGQNIQNLLKPLVDEATWQEECRFITHFIEEDGDGTRLQQLLLAWKARQSKNGSWLRSIWDDQYLSFREMLPINMNYCFQMTANRWGEVGLARMIIGLCEQLNRLRRKQMPAEQSGNNYLSMDMMRHIMYTRIPAPVRDIWTHLPMGESKTAAVVCRGHWFILTLEDENCDLISPFAVSEALNQIKTDAAKMNQAEAIGAMTCVPRNEAFCLRERLLHNLLNRTNMESIEKALFVVCLDEPLAEDESFGHRALTGDAANRWFDKSLQIICTDNEHIAMNMEHAGCDAGNWVHLLNQMDQSLLAQPIPLDEQVPAAHVRPLEWNLEDDLEKDLQAARSSFKDMAENVAMAQKELTCLSKDTIKSKKCRPDAVVQMMFQAAYYSLTGNFRSVYESVSTRNFYEGRTECARPLTEESVAFVKAFVDHTEVPDKLKELYRTAEQVHGEGIKCRQKGLGPERHVRGLEAIYEMYSGTKKGANLVKPVTLDLKGYQILGHSTLSTSGITAPSITYFGFGPVVSDGLGIGYGLKADSLNLMVSSYPESGIDAGEFITTVEKMAQKWLTLFSL